MIHYNKALNPSKFSIPVCRPNSALNTTTDTTKVTCMNCLRAIGKVTKTQGKK